MASSGGITVVLKGQAVAAVLRVIGLPATLSRAQHDAIERVRSCSLGAAMPKLETMSMLSAWLTASTSAFVAAAILHCRQFPSR